jgi:hypothetical protein
MTESQIGEANRTVEHPRRSIATAAYLAVFIHLWEVTVNPVKMAMIASIIMKVSVMSRSL